MIGASREMVSKVMRDLELSGYILCENNQVTIWEHEDGGKNG
jgi:CRP/FNR family cyclic AMP-dependent transcriptional regulator